MEIIVTHRQTDFDALRAQIAAGKLYPEAEKVMAGGLEICRFSFFSIRGKGIF